MIAALIYIAFVGVMTYVCNAVTHERPAVEAIFEVIFWLIEKAVKHELPRWTVAALGLPVVAGAILSLTTGSIRDGVILVACGLVVSLICLWVWTSS